MVLTNKQKSDLHGAILEYCETAGFAAAAEAFSTESGVASGAVKGGVLEKKWSAVLRQQKKISDLEKKVKEMQEELDSGGGGGGPAAFVQGTKKGVDLSPAAAAQFSNAAHRGQVNSLVFHPSYSVVVSTSEDATIRVWDCDSGEMEKTLKGHTNSVQDACFNIKGDVLATCSADFTVKVWDFNEFLCVKTLKGHEHNVSSVNFLQGDNNDKLLSASRDCTVKMWDAKTGFCLKTFAGQHDQWVRRVVPNAWHPNVFVTCSDDQSIALWDATTGKCREDILMTGHEHVIECVTWLGPAAVKAVTESTDFSDLLPPAPAQPAAGGAAAAKDAPAYVRPMLLSGSRDKTIRLWDAVSGTELKVYKGHNNWVRNITVGNQGKLFYSCSDDKTIKVWDLLSGRCTKTVENAHAHFVTAMAFAPNQRRMASGGVDCVVKFWPCR
eukprot:SAG22_NODE_921_length_6492_cov_5.072423_2_plen_439_part_00